MQAGHLELRCSVVVEAPLIFINYGQVSTHYSANGTYSWQMKSLIIRFGSTVSQWVGDEWRHCKWIARDGRSIIRFTIIGLFCKLASPAMYTQCSFGISSVQFSSVQFQWIPHRKHLDWGQSCTRETWSDWPFMIVERHRRRCLLCCIDSTVKREITDSYGLGCHSVWSRWNVRRFKQTNAESKVNGSWRI